MWVNKKLPDRELFGLDGFNLNLCVVLAVADFAVTVTLGFVANDGNLWTLGFTHVLGCYLSTSKWSTYLGLGSVVGHEDSFKGNGVSFFVVAKELYLKGITHGNNVLFAACLDN